MSYYPMSWYWVFEFYLMLMDLLYFYYTDPRSFPNLFVMSVYYTYLF